MSLVLAAAGLCLLALPGLARRPPQRLPPRDWARAMTGCLVVGGVALELGLVLLAVPTLLRQVGVPALALACERMVGSLAPGGPAVGWPAAALALVVGVRAYAGLRRARRARVASWVEPGVGARRDHGWYDLVLLPTRRVLAVSVAASRPQIVLTQGLLDVLTAEEAAAVLRHEEAHLRHRHDRVLVGLVALEAAFGTLPGVSRSVGLLRLGLERWADEESAAACPDDRSILHAALARVTADACPAGRSVAAFGGAAGVVERLASLERPAPPGSRILARLAWSPALVLASVATTAALTWAGQARAMLAMAGMCRV